MTAIRAFFPKIRAIFFPISKNGQGGPPPPPSSYAPACVFEIDIKV